MHSGLWLSAVLSTSRLATLSLMGSTFAESDPFRALQVICNTRRGVRHRAPHAARGAEPPRRTGSCDVSRDPTDRTSRPESTSQATLDLWTNRSLPDRR